MGMKLPEINTATAEGLMKGCHSAEGSSGSWTPKPLQHQLQKPPCAAGNSNCPTSSPHPCTGTVHSWPQAEEVIQPKAHCSSGWVRGNKAQIKWKTKKTFRLPKTFPFGGSPAPTSSPAHPAHGRRSCPLRWPRFDPSFPWGRFSSGLCGTRSCKPAMQRRGSHCFSALIHTDSKRLGKREKKNALKILLTGWKMKAKWNTAQSVKTKSQQAHWKTHSSARTF